MSSASRRSPRAHSRGRAVRSDRTHRLANSSQANLRHRPPRMCPMRRSTRHSRRRHGLGLRREAPRRHRRGERRSELRGARERRVELREPRGSASKHRSVASRSREHCRQTRVSCTYCDRASCEAFNAPSRDAAALRTPSRHPRHREVPEVPPRRQRRAERPRPPASARRTCRGPSACNSASVSCDEHTRPSERARQERGVGEAVGRLPIAALTSGYGLCLARPHDGSHFLRRRTHERPRRARP